jgi:hypothetical protein
MKTATVNTKPDYIYTKSVYNPELDKFSGKIIFQEQFERAQKSLSDTIIPKDILDKINKEFKKR